MGSYSQLQIGCYPILSIKNSFDKGLVELLFLNDDYISEKRSFSSRSVLVWGDAYAGENGKFTFKGFKQTAKICKQRLEIFGTSLKKAKKDFTLAKKIAKEEDIYDFPLTSFSYKEYLLLVSDIISKGDIHYDMLYTTKRESLITGELGIIGQSLDTYLYSILHSVPDDTIVEYDLSDVISGGWVKENEVRSINHKKIIILTEGKTDVEFISLSLQTLYPNLFKYYHFIDFDEFKVESNASALVKLITSFSAANVTHPIIALFDNDTTGIMEMKKLKSVNCPSNIKIIKLPDIQFAKKYPTFGPTGRKIMNVNGLACGIEMYLGSDVLEKDGETIPVRWTAFNDKENKYQGEVSEKKYVHENFRSKLKSKTLQDFTNMEILLSSIFKAF